MARSLLLCLAIVFAVTSLGIADDDVLISDFEQADYAGWTVEGEAFGKGPARGTLPGQMPVSGYEGKGLVNSFLNGDGSTGTLTSPPFRIERAFINFLIGGGGYEGETCVELHIDGKLVRTALGPNTSPGGSEELEWTTWNVRDFAGKSAVIRIVDARTGGWGHINADHFVQSEVSRSVTLLRREFNVTGRYLWLPVTTGARKRVMRFLSDRQIVREFEIELADKSPQFWFSTDVSAYRGQSLTIETKLPADSGVLATIQNKDELPQGTTVYQERLRPQFHFTTRQGWLNDPNGLVFDGQLYHLFYQHNPYGVNWGNMHWAHSTSPDLVHWSEQPIALFPRKYGDWAFSGSAVLDTDNSSGWGTEEKPAMVAAFTSTGRGECMVYSCDGGQTWTEFAENPVVKHAGRDPRLVWHAPTKRWVMAVYDEQPGNTPLSKNISFYTSPDLKIWELQSRIPGYYECPDLFELPVAKGDESRWVLYGADGLYALGTFDGRTFVPEGPKQQLWYGRFYAAQTWSNTPGRRIQIGWGNGISFPEMGFNQQMTVPVELTLHQADGRRWLGAAPVRELQSLRGAPTVIENKSQSDASRVLAGLEFDTAEILCDLGIENATEIGLRVRGVPVVWTSRKGELTVQSVAAPVLPENGRLRLHILIDRGSVEVFAQSGKVAISAGVIPADDSRQIELVGQSAPTVLHSVTVYPLESAWRK